MTIQSGYGGGPASWNAAMGRRDSPTATKHVVKPKSQSVDDGAHGTHDYGDVHPQVLGRLDAHGARLDNHNSRLDRLEAHLGLDLGSPSHGEQQKPAYPQK